MSNYSDIVGIEGGHTIDGSDGDWVCPRALWPRPWSSDDRLLPENVEEARQRYFVSPLTGEANGELMGRIAKKYGPRTYLDINIRRDPAGAQEIRDRWVAEQLR